MARGLRFIAAITIIAGCGDSTGNTGASEGTSSTGDSMASSTTTALPPTTGTSAAPTCAPNEVVCVSETEQAVCDDDGLLGAPKTCPDGGACVTGLGCVACEPDEVRCDGEVLQQCSDARAWEDVQTCSAAQGLQCDAGAKACAGACAPQSLGRTASGCEFYAVSTLQLFQNGGIFAVVLENPGDIDANVTITRDDKFTPVVDVVPAGGVRVIELPFVATLANTNKGERVRDGAYRIQTDAPVKAYQYNTLNNTASTDSSLLWPRHTWGTHHFVATYGSTAVQGGFYRGGWAVVGGAEELSVEATALPGTKAKGGPGFGVDGNGKAPLGTGDVLQIISADEGDLTGTMLVSDKPVQVFGIHECSFMPADTPYCDHLEEVLLPVSQLGTEYVLAAPVRHKTPAQRRGQVVRIVATEANTTLTYDPPRPDAPTLIAGPGEFVELPPSAEHFVLATDKPVLVAQYMAGALFDADNGTDPAMLIALPTSRWHTTHHVHTIADWLPVDVDILAPTGAVVTLGGEPVTGFVDIGDSPYQIAHVRFTEDPGLAEITADQPIAVNVYATRPSVPASSFWHSTGGALAP
jgi:hypothetical protein